MIERSSLKCKNCENPAIFGIICVNPKIFHNNLYCEIHKRENDINLVENKCKSCRLICVLDNDNYCNSCNPTKLEKYNNPPYKIVNSNYIFEIPNGIYKTNNYIIFKSLNI